MRNVPILLLGFNRPALFRGLIEGIRPAAPTRVYVVVDGPRPGVASDQAATRECHEAVQLIDWPCQIATRFREENFGCGRGVSDAISWFFGQEQEGIILEDDVRVHPSFFPWCGELLSRYRDDDRVNAVSGCNFVPPSLLDSSFAYRFTRVTHVWGWATWRRAWREYRYDLTNWRRELPLSILWERCDHSWQSVLFWTTMFDLTARGVIDSWDFQLIYAALRLGSLTATANVNLVANLGIGPEATHTSATLPPLPAPATLAPPYAPPPEMAVDEVAERWVMRNVLGATVGGLSKQAMRFMGRHLKKRWSGAA